MKPNNNWKKCPVRLIEKYISLLPKTGVKPNFYLQSLRKTKPNCWYSTIPVEINTLHKVVSSLLKNAGLDGFFTNHSLHRTCATRLFQAGQDSKIVKEITGHISDSVQKYQTMSTAQKMHVSSIIQRDVEPIKLYQAPVMEIVHDNENVSNDEKFKLPKLQMPVTIKKNVEIHENEVDAMSREVSNIIQTTAKSIGDRKAKLTIQLEFDQ